MNCFALAASNPSTCGGWWQEVAHMSGFGSRKMRPGLFGALAWACPGPWHSSHCTPRSDAFTVTVEPPGFSYPVTWQPTQSRLNSLNWLDKVVYARAWAVRSHTLFAASWQFSQTS